MNIVFLTDIVAESGSWIGRYRPLCERVVAAGHSVTVYMPSHTHPAPAADHSQVYGVVSVGPAYFEQLANSRLHHSTAKLFSMAFRHAVRVLRDQLLKQRVDAVIIGKPLPVSSTIGVILSRVRRSLLVLDCDDRELLLNNPGSRMVQRFLRYYEDRFPRFADVVTTNTTQTHDRLVRLGVAAEKVIRIPNGVQRSVFDAARHTVPPRDPDDAVRILYFGDITLASGHEIDVLLRAFADLMRRPIGARVRLDVIGDGADTGQLRALARRLGVDGMVEWHPRMTQTKLAAYLSRADITIDPVGLRRVNQFRAPLKIVESMYAGVPVITSDVGDRRLTLGDSGLYVDAGDPKSTADAMEFLASHPETRHQIGQRGRKRARIGYTWDTLGDQFVALIEGNASPHRTL